MFWQIYIFQFSHIYLSLHKHNNKTGERGSQKLTINSFYYYPLLLYNAISYYWLASACQKTIFICVASLISNECCVCSVMRDYKNIELNRTDILPFTKNIHHFLRGIIIWPFQDARMNMSLTWQQQILFFEFERIQDNNEHYLLNMTKN